MFRKLDSSQKGLEASWKHLEACSTWCLKHEPSSGHGFECGCKEINKHQINLLPC